jgi:hypothetical protein
MIARFTCAAKGDLKTFPFDAHFMFFRIRSKVAEDWENNVTVAFHPNPNVGSHGPELDQITVKNTWRFAEYNGCMDVVVLCGDEDRSGIHTKMPSPSAVVTFGAARHSSGSDWQ